MTPISGGFANKTQNFEAVAQYQFDFGLRPSLGYVLSKGKDIEASVMKIWSIMSMLVLRIISTKICQRLLSYKINQLE